MNVADQLKTSRRTHIYGSIYTIVTLLSLLFGQTTLTAVLLSVSLLCSAWVVYRVSKLLKSPFMYLAELENLTKQHKESL